MKVTNTDRYYPPATDFDYDQPKRIMLDKDLRREKYEYK
jgi:hypothetical protein